MGTTGVQPLKERERALNIQVFGAPFKLPSHAAAARHDVGWSLCFGGGFHFPEGEPEVAIQPAKPHQISPRKARPWGAAVFHGQCISWPESSRSTHSANASPISQPLESGTSPQKTLHLLSGHVRGGKAPQVCRKA